MRYEIVDKKETFVNLLNGEISSNEIEIIDFKEMITFKPSNLSLKDVDDENVIFVRKHDEKICPTCMGAKFISSYFDSMNCGTTVLCPECGGVGVI